MSKRFVSIWFPHLATDWFELRKPELKNVPFVLTAPSRGKIIIKAANPLAQKSGIYLGMALADARATIPSLLAFDDKPALVPQLLQRSAEWFIRFTPHAAADLPDGVVLDVSGCTHLWNGDEAYVSSIVNRLKAKGYHARAAIADTIGAAWAVARFSGRSSVVLSNEQGEAILQLPPEALRLEPSVITKLHKLGLIRINDFIGMPRPSLRRRFGKHILLRIDQVLGTQKEIFQPVYPIEPYHERLPCIEPITTRSGIEIALERLLELLCSRLRKEGKGLRDAYFRCYRTDSSAQGIQISTNKPSQNITHLFHLFSLKIDTLEPKEGIELFVLEATKVDVIVAVQDCFWKEIGGLNDVHLSELLDRVAAKVGPQVIHRFLPAEHHLPERSVKQTATFDEKKTTEWQLDKPRPIRLLSPPEKIDVTAPVPDYPPMNFRYKGSLHKIIRADGPERIEQEWWIAQGRHRDYYAVEDEEGCRYWLFRSGHYDAGQTYGWYLHGFFA